MLISSRQAISLAVGLLLNALFGMSADAAASCLPLRPSNFADIPLELAVVTDSDDFLPNAPLSGMIAKINEGRRDIALMLVDRNDLLSSMPILTLQYDGVVVLDNEWMVGGKPKYNDYLLTYRDRDLSNQTIIIDYRFDSAHKVDAVFVQVAATSRRARDLFIEIALMALADLRYMTDSKFMAYYWLVEEIATKRDDDIDESDMKYLLAVRKAIIEECFLKTR